MSNISQISPNTIQYKFSSSPSFGFRLSQFAAGEIGNDIQRLSQELKPGERIVSAGVPRRGSNDLLFKVKLQSGKKRYVRARNSNHVIDHSSNPPVRTHLIGLYKVKAPKGGKGRYRGPLSSENRIKAYFIQPGHPNEIAFDRNI